MAVPPWLGAAFRALGEREIPGPEDNPRIIDFSRAVGADWVRHDETPWCAAFVGACLERVGQKSTGSLRARSYTDYGNAVEKPVPGAIAVLRRGSDPAKGHVGFVLSVDRKGVLLLGGNQSDRVSVARFSADRVLAYRWPESHPLPGGDESDGDFLGCLAHVLRHEGGWTNDPHDPGGATNQGITLARFASHLGERIDGGSSARLEKALRAISPRLVREIYYKHYWSASRAHVLPSGMDLIHFDCAVNQGVGRAAKFLQSAVGARVDGEIGPKTLAAAHRADLTSAVRAYHGLRTKHYRGLKHFWRFGRGWLSRVDNIRDLALETVTTRAGDISHGGAQRKSPSATPPHRIPEMETYMNNAPKWWGKSITLWGAFVTALSTVLPLVGPLFGLDISSEAIEAFGERVVLLLQVLGGIVGTLLTIYGRWRARATLQQRAFAIRV